MALMSLGFFQETIIGGNEEAAFRRLCGGDVEGIERGEAKFFDPHGAVPQGISGGDMERGVLGHGDGVVPLDVVRIPKEFQQQIVARDKGEPASTGFLKDPFDGFGLQADSDLREIVERTVETAAVEE